MSYSVYPTPNFKKFFKKLSKKYPSLKTDLQEITKILKEDPNYGIHLGQGIHKIRMSIASKGKGKSGGARVITYLVTKDNEIYLVYIYDKSKLENITKEQVIVMLEEAKLIK